MCACVAPLTWCGAGMQTCGLDLCSHAYCTIATVHIASNMIECMMRSHVNVSARSPPHCCAGAVRRSCNSLAAHCLVPLQAGLPPVQAKLFLLHAMPSYFMLSACRTMWTKQLAVIRMCGMHLSKPLRRHSCRRRLLLLVPACAAGSISLHTAAAHPASSSAALRL